MACSQRVKLIKRVITSSTFLFKHVCVRRSPRLCQKRVQPTCSSVWAIKRLRCWVRGLSGWSLSAVMRYPQNYYCNYYQHLTLSTKSMRPNIFKYRQISFADTIPRTDITVRICARVCYRSSGRAILSLIQCFDFVSALTSGKVDSTQCLID